MRGVSFAKLLATIVLVLAILGVNGHATTIVVKVGAGTRPPFLIDKVAGMGPEIISALNLVQSKFTFELVPVPISRRVQSLKDGWVDIVMWDNINWGWEGLELDVSVPLLHSKDIFISYANDNKTQAYFSSFSDKRICGVSGYHYKFLNYETEYYKLKEMYDIRFVRTEEESIKMALHKRCDVSAVSESALNWFFKLHPQNQEEIIISNIYDTQYTRHFLLPKYAPISAAEVNVIVKKAYELGLLAPIYKKYGQTITLN